MVRSILSIGLALFLLTVVNAGSCFACPRGPMPVKSDCCGKHGKCPMTAAPAHSECGTPAPEALTVEKGNFPAGIVVLTAAPAMPTAPLAVTPRFLDTGPRYSPPDLRILNSSLTI